MVSATAIWPTGPVSLSWLASEACDLPITGAHGFCFLDGKVLVCEIDNRGWSIPGGHLLDGETPADCLEREIREEACAEVDRALLVGFLVADHSINPHYAGSYPTKSALAMFAVTLGELRPYVPASESRSRKLVAPDALPSVHHQWDPVLDEAYREARRRIAA